MGLFSSTAEYYRRYRSDVPEDVARYLSGVAPHGSPRRLIDVGTGTGFVIRAMLPWFDEAVGVDVDPDLLAVARQDVAARSDGAVELIEAPAESFVVPDGRRADLVTVCRAFHWFDRPAFLANVVRQTRPGAMLAVFGDRSVWAGGEPWKERARGVVQEFLGTERRAGNGMYSRPRHDYADDLLAAGFTDLTTVTIPVRRTRSVDSVIGYLHSTSFASPAQLGERIDAFDDRIRQVLAPLAGSADVLEDSNAFTVLTGTVPVAECPR